MSKKGPWNRSLPLTLAIGVWCGVAAPSALLAQGNSRPPVVVDRTVLDQLGPPSNLPEMLLHQEQNALPPAKVVLIPPHGDRATHGRHTHAPQSGPTDAVHLHPIKPHKESRPATLSRPAKTAVPVAKTSEPVTLMPTLAPPPVANPIAPAVTSESLAPPPEPKSKPPTKPAKAAAAIAATAATPLEAAPMPAIAAPPPVIAPVTAPASAPAPAALSALTAQPAGTEAPPATTATQDSLSTIRFDKESARLPDGARDLLAHLASRMTEDGTIEVQLFAYAGGNEENASKARRLSLSRALAVRAFLIDQGVRSTRIEVRALGNKVPEGDPERVDIAVQKRG